MPTPTESLTHMTELALPPHTNSHGTVFGGQVMSWIDVCGGIAAMRHCGSVAVTAAVDSLAFLAPVHLGNIVCLTARVNAAFTTSVEVEVVLDVEDPETRTTHRCVEAYLTFVSLGDDGPRQVPALIAESEAEKAREAAAHERRRDRLARRRKARTETNEGNNP